jgi:DNA-binding LacI/PurR family transcriptional regulator
LNRRPASGVVRRVLNHSPLVSEATRQRVLAAIERLGYQPNPVARAFGRRRTQILELLVPLTIGTLFLDVVRGIEDGLGDSGYTLLVRTMESQQERQRAFEQCGVRGRADGALALWTTPPPHIAERLAAEHFPMVLLNVVDPRVSSVGVDHDAAARSGVEYCARLGHRRIGLVDRRLDLFDAAGPGICAVGYREAVASAGLEVHAGYEQMAELSQAGGAATVHSLLDLPRPPTAIIAASDVQTIGAQLAARDRGRQIPKDVSIVGYSDSAYLAYLG